MYMCVCIFIYVYIYNICSVRFTPKSYTRQILQDNLKQLQYKTHTQRNITKPRCVTTQKIAVLSYVALLKPEITHSTLFVSYHKWCNPNARICLDAAIMKHVFT